MNVDIRLRHLFYRGDRKTVEVRTYTSRQRTTIRDLTGAELRWILAPAKGQAPTLEKTTAPGGGITITGTFNADPAVNTQVVVSAARVSARKVRRVTGTRVAQPLRSRRACGRRQCVPREHH
jgi:hypothetical protein